MKRFHPLTIAAVVVFAIGVVLSLQTAMTAQESLRVLQKRSDDLRQLRDLQGASGKDRGALAVFEQLPNHSPEPLADLAKQALPNTAASVRLRESRPALSGWSVQSVEVSFDSAPLADVSRFLALAEAQSTDAGNRRPPWRLKEITVSASEQTPGVGRAALVLEALEKTGGGTGRSP
jgi:hypothetical protein